MDHGSRHGAGIGLGYLSSWVAARLLVPFETAHTMNTTSVDGVRANPLKHFLRTSQPCFVFAVRAVRNANVVAIAQAAGYQAIYVDFQHSPIDLEAASSIFQAAAQGGLTALARLPALDTGFIARVLDSGSHGLMLADVRTAEQAREFVRSALMTPAGERSAGFPVDPRFLGTTPTKLRHAINEATLLIAMIESPEGILRIEDIAAVPGIDAIQIGSADLTAALGIPGQFSHQLLLDAYRQVTSACWGNNKPFIVGGIRTASEMQPFLDMGAAPCFFTGSDTGFVIDAARMARERVGDASGSS